MNRRRRVVAVAVGAVVIVAVLVQNGPGRDGEGGSGVLRLGLTPLGSLDPAQARSLEQVLVADQLFDSLTATDPVTLAVIPSLAASWTATPDQRQWDFVLRPDAVFANDRSVTAADVKYSLERLARPGSGSPAVDLLTPVTGYRELRGGASGLSGVTVPEPDVVRISLDQPWSVLPAVVSSPVFAVVPREAVEAPPPAASFAEKPLGSGPFRLVTRRGPSLSMVPAPGSSGRVEDLEITVYDDVASAYRAFRRGEVDWSRVPPEEVDAAGRRYGRSGFRASVAELFYGFNLRNPKFADVRFREAVVRAIDRRAIVAAVYQGTASPVDGVVLAGRPDGQRGGCGRCGFDPVAARALLAEVFPGTRPPDIALDFDDEPGQEAVAQAMQVGLGNVGIRALLRPRAADTYDDFTLSGQQDVFRLGWIAAYPSPDAVLAPLFASGSPDNITAFSAPAVDEGLRAARVEADPARRTERYREVEQAVLDLVPVIPIARFQLHTVVSRRVHGLRLSSLGSFDAAAVRIG